MENMKIIELSVGKPDKYVRNGKSYKSAVAKKPKQEVFLSKEGLSGDAAAHTQFHGGPDRALCLYPFEHYSRWESEFGKKLPLPAFGENITASGIVEAETYIGDIFKIGEAVVQVTQGRIPCSTISRYNSLDPLLKRIFDTCLSGFFFRVLEEGTISRDSCIQLVDRHPSRVSVFEATMPVLHRKAEKDKLQRILSVPELAIAWQMEVEKLLKRIK